MGGSVSVKMFAVGDMVKVSYKSIHVLAGFVSEKVGQIIGFKGVDGNHSAIVQYGPAYAIEVRISDIVRA